ncbi:MAG: ornithine--oxo-acid transaminase [Tissierellia bacterium]|nr:ornithine--oxo-acid transaminase [Tissierellia bacterium]
MYTSQELIEMHAKYGAKNYNPLPIVIAKAEGVWVEDPEGRRYIDMLSAYSAMNHGHRHPKVIEALKDQADRVTLTSRAFENNVLAPFCKKVAELTGKDKVLPMNTGAEAVETAIKTARRWAADVKGVPVNQSEIIVSSGNFHGRTTTIISFSNDENAKRAFGPYTPGFKTIPFGDAEALKGAINENTAAFLTEPIQGEAGIIMPEDGFLKEVAKICKENNVLFIADEIQTGLGRTGKNFACDWEEVKPDIYIMGKALGGGVMPISCIAANKEILEVFNPGSHGSTFGGNPLACACAIAALDILEEEKLLENSVEMGEYFMEQLKEIDSPLIKEIRGRGLLIGVDLVEEARPYCEELAELGLLCKDTHEYTIRFAPPLIITKEEIDWAIDKIRKIFLKEALA